MANQRNSEEPLQIASEMVTDTLSEADKEILNPLRVSPWGQAFTAAERMHPGLGTRHQSEWLTKSEWLTSTPMLRAGRSSSFSFGLQALLYARGVGLQELHKQIVGVGVVHHCERVPELLSWILSSVSCVHYMPSTHEANRLRILQFYKLSLPMFILLFAF